MWWRAGFPPRDTRHSSTLLSPFLRFLSFSLFHLKNFSLCLIRHVYLVVATCDGELVFRPEILGIVFSLTEENKKLYCSVWVGSGSMSFQICNYIYHTRTQNWPFIYHSFMAQLIIFSGSNQKSIDFDQNFLRHREPKSPYSSADLKNAFHTQN